MNVCVGHWGWCGEAFLRGCTCCNSKLAGLLAHWPLNISLPSPLTKCLRSHIWELGSISQSPWHPKLLLLLLSQQHEVVCLEIHILIPLLGLFHLQALDKCLIRQRQQEMSSWSQLPVPVKADAWQTRHLASLLKSITIWAAFNKQKVSEC